jgi:hypothetical protein
VPKLLQRAPRVGRERRQFNADLIPAHVEIDPVIRMAKPVAEAANVMPWLIRHEVRRCIPEPERGLADALQAALDASRVRPSRSKASLSMPAV